MNGQDVLFATPDVNWTDVHEILMGKGTATYEVPGEAKPVIVREPHEKLVFTGMVTVDTDLRNFNNTVFVLSGPADVGYSAATVHGMFIVVALYCRDNNISEDADTWVLLPRATSKAALIIRRNMELIVANPLMRVSWEKQTPVECKVNTLVTIRHTQGH